MISKTNIMSMFLRLVFFEMISTGCPISRIVLLWKLFHASLRKARRPSVCVVYGMWLTASSPRRTPAVPALGISSSSTNFNGNVCSLENIRELSFFYRSLHKIYIDFEENVCIYHLVLSKVGSSQARNKRHPNVCIRKRKNYVEAM